MNMLGFTAEASISNSRGHFRMIASEGTFLHDQVVTMAQASQCCPPGFECESCVKQKCVQCTQGFVTGFCQDYTACPDGSRSELGTNYWCSYFSSGPHFTRCV